MGRRCSVCAHQERDAIDSALVRNEPNRRIAAQFALTEQSLRRHRTSHVPAALARAHEAAEVVQGDSLLAEARFLQARALRILRKAEQEGDLRAATAAIREARASLELLARLMGELEDRPQVSLVLTSEWSTVRAAILEALEPHPAARADVSLRLVALQAAK
jgi:hypothetical protein